MKAAQGENNLAGKILRGVLLERMEKNPSYSLRSMARSLGVSHTYLSLVMSGKKALPARRATEFTALLKLTGPRAAELLRPATGARTSSAKSRVRRNSEPFHLLEHDRFRAVSSWYHIAILDLIDVEGFRPDIPWISQKLGIKPQQAKDAIERLQRIGLVREENGQLMKGEGHLYVPTRGPNLAIREFHRQMIAKAAESIDAATDAESAARDLSGTTMAIDPARLPGAKKKIARFRKELLEYLSGGQKTELYQLNVQLFRLTKK